MNKIIGYTTGVFDLFHIGHLNLLKNAKGLCDYLIVGCTIDDIVFKTKNKYPVIPFNERIEILRSIKYVDAAVAQTSMDKMEAWNCYKFDIMFVGDDWKNTQQWNTIEKGFKNLNVKIIYFPYTISTSSTKINTILDSFRLNS
ncbi:MAG: adenylyltransferase/cytidyltransferase family protein [Bacteroidales bacterium]|nr:adenylyltransferase/cytidyltransferase family protein [Bacteroidales bacterium]